MRSLVAAGWTLATLVRVAGAQLAATEWSVGVTTVAARYTSPGRPRAVSALLTARTSNSVRLISAVTFSPEISTSAHDAVGSPSNTQPALPALTITFHPRSRTSGIWV